VSQNRLSNNQTLRAQFIFFNFLKSTDVRWVQAEKDFDW